MDYEKTTMGIDRTSPVPYYLQLSGLIEHSISSGQLGPGDRLPTESDLCRDYDLARSTVRETLRHLATQGRIKMVPRRGAFVLEQNPSDWRLQVTQGFFEAEVDRHRRSVETNVLEAGFEPLPENAAAGLDLDVGTIGFKLARVRRLDGKLALYSVNFLPATIGQVISKSTVINGSGSLNRTLLDAGYKVYGARRSVEAMGANKAQVGFLNTFSVLLAEEKYGIVPALAVLRKYTANAIDPDAALSGKIEPFYKGQFIASKASGIKTFADLKGKTFCFVDPNSTSGYIVPHIVLKANGIDPDKDFKATQNAGSHNNVAIAVYKGDCDAGSTFIDVVTDATANLKGKYPDIADKVTAFADTDRIPNDGVQYVKTLDPKLAAAITEGLVAMAQDAGGNAVLKGLYTINGFQKIDATFYDDFAAVLKKAGVDPATLVK